MTTGRPLRGEEIRALLAEVAERLEPRGQQHVVIIVGGSLLAWHGLRDSTEDVDSARRFDEELREAVARVALQHDLAPGWLNADAAPFLPATFDEHTCELLLECPRLRVLGAALRDVFVMKLYRSQPNDVADMTGMWSKVGFGSAKEVVDAFVAAYPHAPEDPDLSSFVVDIAARAGHTLPLR